MTLIRNVNPASHHIAEIKDILWIMILRFNDNTPMWVGWNSQYSTQVEKEQKQGVWYLPQINASPTSFTVVAETMKRTLTLADESKRNTISVTADLAVAKMMMKLQSEESHVYDRIFINFGAFHLEMAFFHAIGKYIELSGGPNILSLAGVISSDSLKGFIKGTHFNRCKRIHPLFYATLRILHLNLFLEETDTDLDLLGTDLHMLFSNKSDFSFQELPSKITDLYYVYQDFSNETKSGKIYVNGFRFLFCFWFFFFLFCFRSKPEIRPVNPGLCPRLCCELKGVGVSVRRDLISFGWPHVGPRVFASALPSRPHCLLFFLRKLV